MFFDLKMIISNTAYATMVCDIYEALNATGSNVKRTRRRKASSYQCRELTKKVGTRDSVLGGFSDEQDCWHRRSLAGHEEMATLGTRVWSTLC